MKQYQVRVAIVAVHCYRDRKEDFPSTATVPKIAKDEASLATVTNQGRQDFLKYLDGSENRVEAEKMLTVQQEVR